MAGVRLPIRTHPLQAFVTNDYAQGFGPIVATPSWSATSRRRSAARCSSAPSSTRSRRTRASRRSPPCASYAYKITRLLPFLRDLRILRTWTGICDISADFSPIMGETGVDGFLVTTGWGTWGFKAIPAGGEEMAELIATGRTPALHRAVRARPLRAATTSWPTRARRGPADALARLPPLRPPADRRVHLRRRAPAVPDSDHRPRRARPRRGLDVRQPRRRRRPSAGSTPSAAGAG